MAEIKDLSKQRAEFAYEQVEAVKTKIDRLEKLKKEIKDKKIDCKKDKTNEICKEKEKLQYYTSDYKSYVKKIPSMIQTNGLSATLAFMYSKGKTYVIIYEQIEEWLKNKRKLKENSEELVKWVISLDSPEYKYITNEVMALFMWLRRFAEGMIEKGDSDGEENNKS